MASSSPSSNQKTFTYDLFLSFRGRDTAQTFVDRLYHALLQTGITSFKYDERLVKDENMVETIETRRTVMDYLDRSIDDSKLHVIVFSKNYASSAWCLDELVRIMDTHKRTGYTAYPIFYDMEPNEVWNQSVSVGEADSRTDTHVETAEAAKRWRDALREAANLTGWELKNTDEGNETKFIEKIAQDIALKLSLINWTIEENLGGMETRVKNVVSSLEIGSDDFRTIAMAGGGKTTLARAVFDHISVGM